MEGAVFDLTNASDERVYHKPAICQNIVGHKAMFYGPFYHVDGIANLIGRQLSNAFGGQGLVLPLFAKPLLQLRPS